MATQFLHGVEIVEVDSGPRPIQTVKSSVIGLVGTAPDADSGKSASGDFGVVGSKNAITFMAVDAGTDGNKIKVKLVDPGSASQSLAVTEYGKVVTVSLATDGDCAITSTATQVITAVNSDAALVTADNTGESGGTGIVSAEEKFLSGGESSNVPFNTPILVSGSPTEAAKFGQTGTIPDAFDGIFAQAGAMVVVVRVEEARTHAETVPNIIGDATEMTGVHALLGAECAVHVAPKILIAPGFTSEESVATALQPIADRLRAVAIIEGPDTTDEAAITYRNSFGSKRLYIVDPAVKAFDTETSADAIKPNSSYVAGVISRTDNDRGFWWSPSNQLLYGITGLSRPVDFKLGDVNSRANHLNENEVTTIIQQDGYRLWGNRTCSDDPKWAFINVVRTADILNDSLQREHLWAVDRCITKTYIEDVQAGVNAYIRSLVAQGALLGGYCWPDPELNTPANMAAGKVYWNFDFTPPAPAEHMTFQSILTDAYYETLMEAA